MGEGGQAPTRRLADLLIVTSSQGRRIRLLFLIDSLGHGGAEQTLVRLATHIDRKIFDLRVAALQVRDGNPLAERIRELGVPVDVIPVDRLRSLIGHLRLIRYLIRVKPDVIHTHLEFSHTLGGIYGRMVGARPMGTLHTFALGRRFKERRRLRLMWLSFRYAHVAVIAPSVAASRHLQQVGRLPASKVRVMPNGVDLEAFRPNPESRRHARSDLGIAEDASVVLTVAVLRKGKGIPDFISAIAEARTSLPTIVGVVVGSGEELPILRRCAEAAGVEDIVIFTGYRPDVERIMTACDVFVLPTHDDLLPTVVAEAMATGLPVIASDVGGVSDLVVEGVTGRLFAAGDVGTLAMLCATVLADKDAAARLGKEGRLRAEESFDIRSQARHLEKFYKDCLAP